jgi:hypothetical protein
VQLHEETERHDEIKDFILGRIVEKDKETVVTREPTLRSLEEALKPDLVVKNQKGVFVVDITVRHEDGDYLRMGSGKIEKYNCLLPDLQQRFDAEAAAVIPIVIGARGAFPKETIEGLKKLITYRKDLLTMSLISLTLQRGHLISLPSLRR